MSQKRQSTEGYDVAEKKRKLSPDVINIESESSESESESDSDDDSVHVTCNGSTEYDAADIVNGAGSIVTSPVGATVEVADQDVRSTLNTLRTCFPFQKFQLRLPPIILKHQLNCFFQNGDAVDQELSSLVASGEIIEIRCFQFTLIVFMKDYTSHVQRFMTELRVRNDLTSEFLTLADVVSRSSGSTSRGEALQTSKITEDDFKFLVQEGLLQMDSHNGLRVGLPRLSLFLKSLWYGRGAVLTMVKRSKNHEIYEQDLMRSKLPKVARLGIVFLTRDIIGAELVERISTSHGQLLRLASPPPSSAVANNAIESVD